LGKDEVSSYETEHLAYNIFIIYQLIWHA